MRLQDGGRRRGPYAKSALRRREILQAALDCFLEKGVDTTSLREIAGRAGMTHAGLLHHFASEDDLLRALLEQRDASEAERTERPSEADPVGSWRSSFLTQLLREHQGTPELTRLYAELTAAAARLDHPAHEYFVARYAQVRATMADHFRTRAARGELAAGLDPERAAMLLAAALDGLQTQWLLQRDLPILEAVDDLLGLLSGGGSSVATSHGDGSAGR